MHGSQMIYAIALILLYGCDPRLAALFVPAHPVLGRYEVCVESDPIGTLVAAWSGPAGPHYRISPVESSDPIEALGGAGDYDRARVARLYGSSRAQVARGWRQEADRFESITLVSPFPDPTLDRLNPGTLVIRWIIQEHP